MKGKLSDIVAVGVRKIGNHNIYICNSSDIKSIHQRHASRPKMPKAWYKYKRAATQDTKSRQ